MATAVVTSKGPVTIPVGVRRRMGLGSGDRVENATECCAMMTFDETAARVGMTLVS